MMTIKSKRNGFTLVELLVVIAIMSILTIIAVSQFQSAKRKSRDVQRKGDISAVSKALLMYYTDYGYFPESVDGQINEAPWGGTFSDAGYDYLKEMPRENYGDIPFCYVTDGGTEPTKFGVFSILENTEDMDYNKLSGDGSAYGPFAECDNNSYNFAILSPNASMADF